MTTPGHTACGSAALPACTALHATLCPWDAPAKVPIIPHPDQISSWEWMKGAATAQDILHQTENLFHPLMYLKIIQKCNGKVSDFFFFSPQSLHRIVGNNFSSSGQFFPSWSAKTHTHVPTFLWIPPSNCHCYLILFQEKGMPLGLSISSDLWPDFKYIQLKAISNYSIAFAVKWLKLLDISPLFEEKISIKPSGLKNLHFYIRGI